MFKITELSLKTKSVEYFGFMIQVHTSANWVATDANGGIWAYDMEPRLSLHGDYWVEDGYNDYVIEANYSGNWCKSKVYVGDQ